ncbi:hypothetical protein [Nevskia soli]|uniref:hypothetical protein n=1 Tax=Nevskia soli TaxID=418856 RepID=UPI0004A6D77B|nr:hypothetical protein [Nevskia soli]
MGVEIRLTDRELPVSPVFIDFLAHILDGRPFDDREWADQTSEALNFGLPELQRRAEAAAPGVMNDARGRAHIGRAYSLLLALLTGDFAPIGELQQRFHFINVIGIPRTGGSYLTAELYRALGIAPHSVPFALAHDGFPEAGPFEIAPQANSWVRSLHTMAEYLSMVELYFGARTPHQGRIVVPKKLTKGIYAGGFFHRILGEAVEHLITLRHPVAACVSSYEKSGGLPADGRFAIRSNIEDWCRRDLLYTGCTAEELVRMDYFDAYLRYWEQYHYYIATTGLSANREMRVVVYGKERLQAQAAAFHQRYGSKLAPGQFKISDTARQRHPDWVERAAPALQRVAALWERIGIPFPLQEMAECW